MGDIARDVARTAVPDSVPLQIETAPHLPLVLGQHGALHRAFANVLLNAVEACDAGGNVTIRVDVVGDDVVVAVRDAGLGISAERLPRIWDPYVSDKTAGTGLGLAIVKQTVAAHGGRVEASSTLGEGTEIRLLFPTVTDHGEARE